MNPLVVAGIAFGASLLGSLTGGSSSMITTPAWIALGAPFATAVAADKVAGSLWTIAASRAYLRGQILDRRLMLGMAATGLIGAAIGALLATTVNEGLLRRAAGLMIVLALLLSLRPSVPAARRKPVGHGVLWALALPLGGYEGMLGSGNGVLTTLLLHRGRRLDLLAALGHYYVLAALWCALAAAIYFAKGAMVPSLTIPATVGALVGGATGSRLGRAGGVSMVRPLFIAAGLVLAAKLVFMK